MLNALPGLESVLNIGAGCFVDWSGRNDIWGDISRAKKKVAIESIPEKAATFVNTDWIPLQMHLIQTLPFPSGSFDLVIGTDFIEHLHKPQANSMLLEAERVARKWIIWFTPVGFLDTLKYQNEHVYTEFDIHNSQWQPEEFISMGYSVGVIKNMHNFGDVHFDAMWVWKVL